MTQNTHPLWLAWPVHLGSISSGHERLLTQFDSTIPQSIHLNLPVSTPGQLVTAGAFLPNFNATIDAEFMLAPTSSLSACANLTTQPSYTYSVSK
jgi:hypothetical protein